MSVTALIMAAGRGIRAAGHKTMIPKQYLPIGGVPMLTRTIGAFADHPSVDDVIVVIHPDDIGLYEATAKHFAACLRPPAPGGPPPSGPRGRRLRPGTRRSGRAGT